MSPDHRGGEGEEDFEGMGDGGEMDQNQEEH
jgi:hypothetical protein